MEVDSSTDPIDLKVKELLKEVEVEYSPSFTELVDDAVSAIKDAIGKIPDELQVTADLAPAFVRDVGADKVEFKFKKPTSIDIGGSYATRCIAKPDVNIDLFIGLPKECFREKDYLDHRYFAKRCLYLCTIKKYLKFSTLVSKVEWSFLQNEARKPVLIVHPAAKPIEVPGLIVRLIPTAKYLFNISKLNLSRSNIRALNQGTAQATPIYNTSILEDMFMENNVELLNKMLVGCKEFGKAVILLKVWARQRSSLYIHDCLNGFLISVIVSYLVSTGKVNNSLKAMQIFRITLDFIANSKLWKRGLFFQGEEEKGILKEERTQYVNLFPVVMCNISAHFNLAFRISDKGFLELQDEAALTLKCMEKCKDGGFEEIFMTKVDFPAKYDLCLRISLKESKEVYASGFCLDKECWRLYEQKMQSVLHQGLSDRAKTVRVTWKNTPSEYSIENGLSTLGKEPLLVGISISSPDKAFRVVDIGPNAENKEEALKFRKFWGERAELRRFKDGTIAESTVWDCRPWTRHLIMKRIVEYVLTQHFSLSNENIVHCVDQLDFCLLHGVEDPMAFSGHLIQAFEVLSKRLRLIQDIPLKISSVQPLDSAKKGQEAIEFLLVFTAFRFTSVFPPEPHPLIAEKSELPRQVRQIPLCIQPLEVMIQLEGSGNWPLDDVAVEKTKTAFLLKIAESLQNGYGMTCSASEDDVDVLMCGFAFRLKIMHERGLSLLKREIGNHQGKRASSVDKKLFIRGQHASMINGLQGRYQLYGPVVRLAKRWVASHLFSACLKEESIELLVAYLFLKPFPFTAPCSRITGFLRFLRLLSEYGWTFSPLVVDINNDLGPDDEKEINENFMRSRKIYDQNSQAVDPPMFIGTAYDKASEAWTQSSPSFLELKRLVAYARSSANLLTKLILHDQINTYRWECLFRTPLSNYDAVILLHRNKLPYPKHLLFPSEMNEGRTVAVGSASKAFHPFMTSKDLKYSWEEIKNKLMIKFDPLQCFLEELQREFPETFKLWYDSLGGDAIGLTWERSGLKRARDEEGEGRSKPLDMLKTVGEAGKGFIRSVYFLKAPRLVN